MNSDSHFQTLFVDTSTFRGANFGVLSGAYHVLRELGGSGQYEVVENPIENQWIGWPRESRRTRVAEWD